MTIPRLCFALLANMLAVTASVAAAPGAVPVPDAVIALKGCWLGVGQAVGKPVTVALRSRAILQDAMVVVDVESSALADPRDRYSAHLLFGSARERADEQGDDIMGFWSDSFGGAFTALGRGSSRSDGFDIVYRYPDSDFINRWTLSGDKLTWLIVERTPKRVDKVFATYRLSRAPCAAESA